MPETKTITVTQENIDNGVRRRAFLCPFALAAKRAFPEAVEAGIGWYLSVKLGPSKFQYWDLSEEARAAILQYDTGGPMQPGTYEISRDENQY